MKILVGAFQCESNTFSSAKAGKDSFYILHGDEAKNKLFASHLFEEAGFEVVPLVYAVSLPSGMVTRECFDEILADFRARAAEHPDADGIYLYLHGAMYVEGLGSGEEWTVKELRKTVGDAIPISLDQDFHGNLADGLIPAVQAISGYRTAPHTDYDEAETRAAVALMRILNEKAATVPHFFRIRVQFADAAQTSVEPYVSIMKMVRELDKDPDVISASVFNGQPWVDAPFMSASVIVYSKANHDAVHAKAKAIADYYEAHKTDLKFGVPALSPEKTVEGVKPLAKPVFVSDSGDNTTAGAGGESAFLLKRFLGSGVRTLYASLYCPAAWERLSSMKPGDRATLEIPRSDEYTGDISIEGEYVKKGRILGFVGEESGEGVLFRAGEVDIVFASVRTSFTMKEHFEAMGVRAADYEAVIVKQGYLWPGAAELAASQVFCMTPGTATNDFSTLPFRNLEGEYYYVKPE
ncbi:MAG: M81 family metallopeptidase [Kiritimatiellae bacterium]|nr:M81 family metallopeptidase [Kiritimatiellia bacterium]